MSQHNSIASNKRAFSLAEILAVVVILSMLITISFIFVGNKIGNSSFDSQMQQFISTMKMAYYGASESDRSYTVTIDISEQTYSLAQLTGNINDDGLWDQELISEYDLGNNCRIVYVLFDDLVDTDQQHQKAFFRVSQNGWQNGGKIVFSDLNENLYSVLVHRFGGHIILAKGDIELLMPKVEDEISF